jgi:hypothetical protein
VYEPGHIDQGKGIKERRRSRKSVDFEKLRRGKEFRKKTLEKIGTNLLNCFYSNFKINKKEVRSLWK